MANNEYGIPQAGDNFGAQEKLNVSAGRYHCVRAIYWFKGLVKLWISLRCGRKVDSAPRRTTGARGLIYVCKSRKSKLDTVDLWELNFVLIIAMGGINDIKMSHGRGKQMNGSPSEGAQSILRSGLGKLARVARIARRGATPDASSDAETPPDVDVLCINSGDSEGKVTEIAPASLAKLGKSIDKSDFPNIPGFEDPQK